MGLEPSGLRRIARRCLPGLGRKRRVQRGPGDLAAFLMNNIWGMRVLCKSNPSRKSLNAIVSGVVASLRSG